MKMMRHNRELTLATALVLALAPTTSFAKCEKGEQKLLLGLQKGQENSAFGRLGKEIQTQFQRDLNSKVCVDIVALDNFDMPAAFAALKDRKAALAAMPFTELANRSDFFRVLTMPFAVQDRRAAARFLRASKRADWSAAVATSESKAIGMAHFGFDQMAAKKSVVTPGDAVGVKFLQSDEATNRIVPLLKATRVAVQQADLATALKEGRVEAQAGDWITLSTPFLVASYKSIVETNQTWRGAVVTVAPNAIKAVSAKVAGVTQAQIEQQISKGIANFNKREAEQQAQAKQNLMRSGKPIYALTVKQRSEWRATLAPVTDTIFGLSGAKPFIERLGKANR